jgi:lipoyl(octanoyl) transferase
LHCAPRDLRAAFKRPWYGEQMVNVRDELAIGLAAPPGAAPVEWRVSDGLTPYEEAVAFMEARAAAIATDRAPELAWLIEHPALYTAGTSAKAAELIEARFPLFESGRGGQMTYHGPGQRVAYVMLDLKRRGPDVRRFVASLEEWIIRTLAAFNVRGERREDRIGVWVRRPDKGEAFEDKIAAIGIRVKRWVTLHGMALNVDPDLSHFSGIVPCGVHERRYGVTSLADLGIPVSMPEVNIILRREFAALFGATTDQAVGNTENNSPGRLGLSSSPSPSR